MEPFYPLHVRVCTRCWLAQLPAFVAPDEIFSEYAYFSAYSDSWVEHSRALRRHDHRAGSTSTPDSLVVELASNDGYLLQHFLPKGIPVLGIDPAANVARGGRGARCADARRVLRRRARASGWSRRGGRPTSCSATTCSPRCPTSTTSSAASRSCSPRAAPRRSSSRTSPGCSRACSTTRSTTSTSPTSRSRRSGEVFAAHGLDVVDVEELPSHGGSLRVYAAHASDGREPSPRGRGARRRARRRRACAIRSATGAFADEVEESKRALLELLIELRRDGKQVVGYGAPGKGNTLLNYCGIRTDFLDYTVDRNPYKHGRFTPGTHIPIQPPERIAETRPDAIVILPWNLAREIAAQLAYTEEWGAKLIVPIPTATSSSPDRQTDSPRTV